MAEYKTQASYTKVKTYPPRPLVCRFRKGSGQAGVAERNLWKDTKVPTKKQSFAIFKRLARRREKDSACTQSKMLGRVSMQSWGGPKFPVDGTPSLADEILAIADDVPDEAWDSVPENLSDKKERR